MCTSGRLSNHGPGRGVEKETRVLIIFIRFSPHHFRISVFHRFISFSSVLCLSPFYSLFSTVLSFIPISHAIAFRHFPGASLSSPLFHSHFFTFLSLHHFITLAPPIFVTSSSFTLSYRHSVSSSSFACLLFLSAFLPLVLWNKLSRMMTSGDDVTRVITFSLAFSSLWIWDGDAQGQRSRLLTGECCCNLSVL